MSPTIDPTPWFVDPASASADNVVTPLVDGIATLGEIDNQIANLQSGDFCLYGAWIMYADSTTLPVSNTTVKDALIAAVGRGAEVRILLYKGMPDGAAHRQEHVKVLNDIGGAGAQVIIDTKHPWQGSHHHKYAVFGKKLGSGDYELTAFVGGIDPVFDRLDDGQHLGTNVLGFYHGWHDAHTKIQGPAATTVWYDFLRRWNEHPTAPSTLKTATTLILPSSYPIVLPTLTNPAQHVEVVYTYSCSRIYRYNFVPVGGIRTIHAAYLNAIAHAQHFIYIEDPFFVDETISTALRDRLNQQPTLTIIVLTNDAFGGEAYYLNASFDIIRQSPQAATQFHACQLIHSSTVPIYVHAKLMIVDDVYYTVGSANVTPRSMTLDSEINVGVVDTDALDFTDGTPPNTVTYTVGRSVRDLRVALWQEHLQAATSAGLENFTSAIPLWVQNTGVSPSRVHALNVAVPPGGWIAKAQWAAYHNTVAHPTDPCV